MARSIVTREEFQEISKHIDNLNGETGTIQKDVASIKTDLIWTKELVKSLNNRLWWLAGVMVSGFVTIGVLVLR